MASSTENRTIAANIKSKRQCKNDDTSTPRRLSSRLNNLQRDGTPVRTSDPLNKSLNSKKSARKNLAVSITQSARIASRSRKRKISTSMYELDYREKRKSKNLFISPSQISNHNINEMIQLSPVELDNEYEIDPNPKGIREVNSRLINVNFIAEGIVEKKIRIFNAGNESNSESYHDRI